VSGRYETDAIRPLSRLPLTRKGVHALLAFRSGQGVTVGQFLAEVRALADSLPPGNLINLCRDRYRFTRAFAAALVAGRTNLLPPNRLDSTIDDIQTRYTDAYVLTDEPGDWGRLDKVTPVGGREFPKEGLPVPEIDGDHLAAIAFTSGSTGPAKAIEKPWRTLFESTLINAAQMGLDDGPTTQVVATVPPQHMFGLETSVLIPLLGAVAASSAQPFMPAEVAAALEEVPRPRVLISVPPYLRALADPELVLPALDGVWSATAPLDPWLASDIEARYATPVHEIYGCSEVGSMARRRPSQEEAWTPFPSFMLTPEGGQVWAGASHLPQAYPLQDQLELLESGSFRIAGRSEDLVNIGGKRTSLAQLNQALLRIPGIEDGVIFVPPETASGRPQRLAALVVAPQLDFAAVRRGLREYVDDVFLPRPIRFVDRLPRTGTGKLPYQAMLALYEQTH